MGCQSRAICRWLLSIRLQFPWAVEPDACISSSTSLSPSSCRPACQCRVRYNMPMQTSPPENHARPCHGRMPAAPAHFPSPIPAHSQRSPRRSTVAQQQPAAFFSSSTLLQANKAHASTTTQNSSTRRISATAVSAKTHPDASMDKITLVIIRCIVVSPFISIRQFA